MVKFNNELYHTISTMKKLFLSVLTVLTLASCSTVVNGKSQSYNIRSRNQKIVVTNKYGKVVKEGYDQLNVTLNKGEGFFEGAEYTVMSGGKTYQIMPKINVGAFVVGNFFVPGLWGWIIDGATGAMYDLTVEGQKVNTIDF